MEFKPPCKLRRCSYKSEIESRAHLAPVSRSTSVDELATQHRPRDPSCNICRQLRSSRAVRSTSPVLSATPQSTSTQYGTSDMSASRPVSREAKGTEYTRFCDAGAVSGPTQPTERLHLTRPLLCQPEVDRRCNVRTNYEVEEYDPPDRVAPRQFIPGLWNYTVQNQDP